MRELRQLSPHFHEKEFVYRTPEGELIAPSMDISFVQVLENLRQYLSLRLDTTVEGGYNGGWRSAAHEQGGGRKSQHCSGLAADLYSPSLDLQSLYRKVREFNDLDLGTFKGVGVYPQNNFLHLDTRRGEPVSWVRCDGEYFYL